MCLSNVIYYITQNFVIYIKLTFSKLYPDEIMLEMVGFELRFNNMEMDHTYNKHRS